MGKTYRNFKELGPSNVRFLIAVSWLLLKSLERDKQKDVGCKI